MYVPKHTHVYKEPGDRVIVQVENFLMKSLSKHEIDIRFLGNSFFFGFELAFYVKIYLMIQFSVLHIT